MPKDPWQRANELSRLRESRPSGSSGSLPPARRGPLFALLLLLVLGAGAAIFWAYRDRVLTATRQTPLPVPVQEVVHRLDQHPPDIDALDRGLGIHLSIGGDYKEVISATRDWGIEWKLTAPGGGRLRLTTSGVEVSCENEKIRNYTVDLSAVFADPAWEAWAKQLKQAGYYPAQRYRDIAGPEAADGQELWLHRSTPLSGSKDVHPAYRLRFKQGELVELLGAIEFASSAQSGKVWDAFVPSDDAALAEKLTQPGAAGTADGAG